MPKFIVVGYYDGTDQAYVGGAETETAEEAFAEIAKDADDGLVLVCAINEETLKNTTPCEDNGNTCFACDYPQPEGEEEED